MFNFLSKFFKQSKGDVRADSNVNQLSSSKPVVDYDECIYCGENKDYTYIDDDGVCEDCVYRLEKNGYE